METGRLAAESERDRKLIDHRTFTIKDDYGGGGATFDQEGRRGLVLT